MIMLLKKSREPFQTHHPLNLSEVETRQFKKSRNQLHSPYTMLDVLKPPLSPQNDPSCAFNRPPNQYEDTKQDLRFLVSL